MEPGKKRVTTSLGPFLGLFSKMAIIVVFALIGCKEKKTEYLPECCSGLGSCLTSSLIHPESASLLGRSSCESNQLCLPNEFVDVDNFVPTTCRSTLGAEGRCLPECLPDVWDVADKLDQGTCPAHHLCAPCHDLISGEPTGACDLGGDLGSREPPVLFDECCHSLGRCIPTEFVPEDDRMYLDNDTCEGDTLLCVPDPFLEEDFLLQTCSSILNAEGRCVPSCLPEIQQQATDLPGDICPAHYLCAPCYDPRTGDSTGVCDRGTDSGPTKEPVIFESCCGNLGSCVPSALVSATDLPHLDGGDCEPNQGVVCAPNDSLNAEYSPEVCRGVLGMEGRCVPACLPEVANQAEYLKKDVCEDEYLCAPCFDPLSGEGTGICNMGTDEGPRGEPVVFDTCCNSNGRCIPFELIPNDQTDVLGQDTCSANGDFLCVPDEFLDGDFLLTTCRSILGAQGRCAPICLPEVAEMADELPQDICPDFKTCAPCYDPRTGIETGICNLANDTGPIPSVAPVVFDKCCDGHGSCLPAELIPEDDLSRLGMDTCEANQGLVCTPDGFMEEHFLPTVCHGILGAEGRCLPACLPDVAAQDELLEKDVCPGDHLCAPCYDPFTGESTGACRLGIDPGPNDGPTIFDKCCGDQGWCVPQTLIPEDLAQRLGEDTCASDDEMRCVPDEFLEDGFLLTTCRSTLGAEGRCAPVCLPQIATVADDLPQDICPERTRCAPCFDPLTGDETGLCELGGDTGPGTDKVVFAKCCNGSGSCIPQNIVSEESLPFLGMDTCQTNEGLVCVPDLFLNDDFVLTICHGVLEAEGRCVPVCLPPVAEQADYLAQDVCGDGQLCAPCNDPFSGDDTGICTLGNNDGLTEEPVLFDTCCKGVGTCVPIDFVPAEQAGQLAAETCGDDQTLVCAPNFFFEDNGPESCQSILNAEGRCLPACLPSVADQVETLPADICQTGHVCAPCYDLYTGAPTGACLLPGDPGPTRPPVTFSECCGNKGTCLPLELISPDQQNLLGQDVCAPKEGLLCVPTSLQDEEFTPTRCTSISDAEGRCLPDCLPALDTQKEYLPLDVCNQNDLCAPCYDPFSGEATGACALPNDPGPLEPPVVFEKCCEDGDQHMGTCMPRDTIPDGMAGHLIVDSCSGINDVCAPNNIVLFPGATTFPNCTSNDGDQGACVPGCYLSWQQSLFFPRGPCGQGEHCVNCTWAGESTGACW